jgi:ketosteroid isomerase-like protein
MTARSGGRLVDVDVWLKSLADAWERRDPDAAAELFTEDATYSVDPHAPPRRGRTAIRDYWAGEVAGQRGTEVRFGAPIVSGDRAAAEWWATIDGSPDGPVTLAGIVMLRFDPDGRCTQLREYWMASPWQLNQPQPGWGT